MEKVRIEVTDNGPLVVSGDVLVVDAEGAPFEAASGQAVALCRCGGSQNKPFCDGSHVSGGFSGKNRAERPEQ